MLPRCKVTGRGRPTHSRRGMASVIAMLFLVVFSALAVGFYAQMNSAMQVSGNEVRAAESLAAAESGLQFMRYHLSALDIPGGTPPNKVLEEVFGQLRDRLTGNPNFDDPKLGPQDLDFVDLLPPIPPKSTPYAILLPAAPGWIKVNKNGAGFRALITENNRQLTIKVIGQAGGTTVARAIEVTFGVVEHTSQILTYGVATRGAVSIDTGAKLLGVNSDDGNIFSTTTSNPALTMANNTSISGEVKFTSSSPTLSINSGASIFGTTAPGLWAPHVKKSQASPEWPVIDTSDYLPFVTKPDGSLNYFTSLPADNTIRNMVLKPGTYSFTGSVNILGVLYIQTPCNVKFNGGANVTGVIAVQNNPTGSPTSTPVANVLSFGGSCTFQGVEALPATSEFPAELRAMTGSQILAPKFLFDCSGNFSSMGGSIVASQITFSGSSSGTIKGTLMNLDSNPVLLSGKTIVIDHTALNATPAGIEFGNHYSPKKQTYLEVNPWKNPVAGY
jgi:hypothetical protein